MIADAPWQRFTPAWPETTLERRVADHARAMPDGVAVIAGDERLTWAEVDRLANALAADWIAAGLKPGDRLGWLGRNRAAFPVVLVATRRARLVLTGLNWRLSAPELAAIAAQAGCMAVVADTEFADRLPAGTRVTAAEELVQILADRPAAPIVPSPDPAEPCTLFFTSGTTGGPKGLVYSLAGVERCVASPHTLAFAPDSRLLIVAPVFHTAGWMWCQYGLMGGMTQILLAAATPSAMLEAVARHRATHAQWVPTMLGMALDQLEQAPIDIGSLEMIAYGAAPIQPALLERAQASLGCAFSQVYGLTETIGPISHLPAADHRRDAGRSQATGLVNPGVELVIRDPAGAALAAGEMGEIHVRMPFPKATPFDPAQPGAQAIAADGWVRTGDAGYLDADGYLHVRDRIGDMIISGGENVFPAEVENVLTRLPGVREAAVFGVKDAHWGERVAAALVMRDGAALDEGAILAGCREGLAGYKCPRTLISVDELPRNATGKVLRRALAARVEAAGLPSPAI